MELHPKAAEGILHSAAFVADVYPGRVRRDGFVPFLLVLRSGPGPDVLSHRHLGRRESTVRGNQVLSLHPRRVSCLAARRPEDVFSYAGYGAHRKDCSRNSRATGRQHQSERNDFQHYSTGGAERNWKLQHCLHASDRFSHAAGHVASAFVLRVRAWLRDQGADVAVSYMVAGCAC